MINHLLNVEDFANKAVYEAIDFLQKTPGITVDRMKLHINEKPIEHLRFVDGSGTLTQVVNIANIHHVYVFDSANICQFAGYVGWIDSSRLRDTVTFTRRKFC